MEKALAVSIMWICTALIAWKDAKARSAYYILGMINTILILRLF